MPSQGKSGQDGTVKPSGKAKVLEVPQQLWRKYGFIMLWGAVGLDLIISTCGYPILGQIVSALLVMLYLLDHVSVRRVVCSFWFAIIDLFFREISVGGDTKLEPLKDGRAVIFVSSHQLRFQKLPDLRHSCYGPRVLCPPNGINLAEPVQWKGRLQQNRSESRVGCGSLCSLVHGFLPLRPDAGTVRL
jgi:hypothetical protein